MRGAKGTRPEPRRCSALRLDGEPCRNWSRRDADGAMRFDPPLCVAHAPREDAAQEEASGNKGLDADLARVGRDLPALGGAEGLVIAPERGEALYAPFFTDDEMAALEALGRHSSLWGEVMLVRGMLRRLLAEPDASRPLQGHRLEQRAATLFAGTDVLARLLQVERQLEIDPEGVPRPIAEALDHLSEEWGVAL